MMDCRACESNVSAFVDDELSAHEAERFKLHVDGCEACAALVESERRVRYLVRAAEAALPAGFTSRWQAALEAERAEQAAPFWRRFAARGGAFNRRVLRYGALAAGVAVVAISVALLSPGRTGAPGSLSSLQVAAAADDMAAGAVPEAAMAAPRMEAYAAGGGADSGFAANDETETITEEAGDLPAADVAPMMGGSPEPASTGDAMKAMAVLPAELQQKQETLYAGNLSEDEAQAIHEELEAYQQEAQAILQNGSYTVTLTLPAGFDAAALLETALAAIGKEGALMNGELISELTMEDLAIITGVLYEAGVEYGIEYEAGGAGQVVVILQ